MVNNSNLHQAKSAKNDEFYTQLTDIEQELKHYVEYFNGKVVLCNCNDALHSNFAVYFSLNFEFLGLKKLICTAYKVDGVHGKVCIYNGDKNGNRVPDIEEWEQYMLEGDGSYDSDECLAFLDEADIVVTNPPFSLFRNYVATLMEHKKKFLIMGNGNAITFKEIFPLIKENKMWLGTTLFCGKMPFFEVPLGADVSKGGAHYYKNGKLYKQINSIAWFTNLDHQKRHKPLELTKSFNTDDYPKYDNYMGFNVDRVCDIPMDDFIEIEIDEKDFDKWKEVYGDDVEIIEEK